MKRTPQRKTAPFPPRAAYTRYTIDMGITQSIIKDFLDCRYRAHLQREGWEPKLQKKSYRFGSLVHDALEFAYAGIRTGKFVDGAAFLWELSDRIDELVAANIRKAAPTESLTEIEQEGAWANALLDSYFDHWEEDWEREWVAVEGRFDQPYHPGGAGTGRVYRIRGRRDAVFASAPPKGPRKGQKGLWLFETKTKAQIDENALDLALAFDFQSLYYLLALELVNPTAYPIRGCLYNILRKPGLRKLKAGKKRKLEETDAELAARTKADIEARPDHYFKRYEIIFPAKVQQEFRRQLKDQFAEFKAWLDGKLPTYRNPSACITKYKCVYLEHCASGSFAGYARTRNPFSELEAPDGSSEPHRPPRRKPRRKEA